LQRSEGDVSDPIKYIYSTSLVDLAVSVCPFLRKLVSQFKSIGMKSSQKSCFYYR